MNTQEMWNCQTEVSELLGIKQPDWIVKDLTAADIAAICQGGCASGAYMPAVTYAQAMNTMFLHGDEVMEYLENELGDLPIPAKDETWARTMLGQAVFYLSIAVETWAHGVMAELEELEGAE